MRPVLQRVGLAVLIIIAFALGFYKVRGAHPAASFQTHPQTEAAPSAARMQSRFASSKLHTQTHAASLIELKDGRLRAFWFSGSREGAKDVEIHDAVFDPAQGVWSTERSVIGREATQGALLRYVSKLGNPVPARAADGRLWLYYVTVSLGGWAGSSITAMHSSDEGETWSTPQRLITSPFINISTLVKGAPFLYDDGTLGLPVYHEFVGKFGELLRLGKNGEVLDKQRLSAGRDHGLQPVVLVQGAQQAQVLMRYAGDTPRRVLSITTHDAGAHWSAPAKTTLANPNAALSAITLQDGRMLAALNDLEGGRDALTLAVFSDGGASWQKVSVLEDQVAVRAQIQDEAQYLRLVEILAKESDAAATPQHVESVQQAVCTPGCRFEFSYPYLLQARNGDLHLVYTWNRSFIKHLWFNPAWLEERLKVAKHDPSH